MKINKTFLMAGAFILACSPAAQAAKVDGQQPKPRVRTYGGGPAQVVQLPPVTIQHAPVTVTVPSKAPSKADVKKADQQPQARRVRTYGGGAPIVIKGGSRIVKISPKGADAKDGKAAQQPKPRRVRTYGGGAPQVIKLPPRVIKLPNRTIAIPSKAPPKADVKKADQQPKPRRVRTYGGGPAQVVQLPPVTIQHAPVTIPAPSKAPPKADVKADVKKVDQQPKPRRVRTYGGGAPQVVQLPSVNIKHPDKTVVVAPPKKD